MAPDTKQSIQFPTKRSYEKANQASLFNTIHNALLNFKELHKPQYESLKLRFVNPGFDFGQNTLCIFLDESPANLGKRSSPSTETCHAFHSFLECYFETSHAFEVSSPGLEPPLVDRQDFLDSVGCMVDVRLWEPLEGRSKFIMHLREVCAESVILGEGTKTFAIPMGSIKEATALWFHSQTPKELRDAFFKLFN